MDRKPKTGPAYLFLQLSFVALMVTHRATKIVLTALHLANKEGEFRLPDIKEHLHLPENPPSNSTVRLILRQMEESGWLERDHPEGRVWHAGDQLDEFMESD